MTAPTLIATDKEINNSTVSLGFLANGEVLANDSIEGNWRVSSDNELVIVGGIYDGEKIPVVWKFVQNRLGAYQKGDDGKLQLIGDIHSIDNAGTRIEDSVRLSITDENLITVTPTTLFGFSFTLFPSEFSLNSDMDLGVKIGEEPSVLDGVLKDRKGRFRYRFTTGKGKLYRWKFTGKWEKSKEGREGELNIDFVYKIGAAEKRMQMPKSFELSEDDENQLLLLYSKNGRTHSLELESEMSVGNGELTFRVEKNQTTEGSEMSFGFTYAMDSGDESKRRVGPDLEHMEIFLKKSDSSEGQRLLLNGDISVSLGEERGIDIGFAYEKRP